jgi:phytanoyl-CoA hydroxylase
MSRKEQPMAHSQTHLQTAPAVTEREVRSYVEDGFHIARGLITPAELAELKADLIALARGQHPCPSLKPVGPEVSDEDAARSILCIHQPHLVSPVMARFASHPLITGILGRLVGAHLPHWDGSVKCMQSMLFAKAPGKPGQAWHQDERYIPTRDRSLTGAWIAIDDATVANGCLWVIPGSHRHGYMHPFKPPTDLVEFDGADECHGFDASGAVPVEVTAGSVVFFNGYLLHRSLRNRSTNWRRALVSHYMNAWSLLPWFDAEVPGQGRQGVGIADHRGVFTVAGRDPYAWKGSAPPSPDAVHIRNFTTPGGTP